MSGEIQRVDRTVTEERDHRLGTQAPSGQPLIADRDAQSRTGAQVDVLRGFLRSHIELPGLRWHLVRAERLDDHDLAPFDAGHDLFADGSLLLLPTPGHTPGSTSLLVRRPSHAPVMLVGDLTYDADLLAAGHVPGAGDKVQMRKTVAGVNAFRQRFPDLTVLAAHDPTAADRLATSLTMATARA